MKDGRKFERIDLNDLGAVYLDSPGMSFSTNTHYSNLSNLKKLRDAVRAQTLEQCLNLLYTAEEEYKSDTVSLRRVGATEIAISNSLHSQEIPESVLNDLVQSNNGDFMQLLISERIVSPKHHVAILERFWEDKQMREKTFRTLWTTGQSVKHVTSEFFLDKALCTEDFNAQELLILFDDAQKRELAILFEHELKESGSGMSSSRALRMCAPAFDDFLRPIATLLKTFKRGTFHQVFDSEAELYESMGQNAIFRQFYELYAFAGQLKNSCEDEKLNVKNTVFTGTFNSITVSAWTTVDEEEQMKYFEHDDKWVRTALALNPNLSEEITEMLADDEEVNVQRAIAMHEDLAQSVLEDLATSRDTLTRILVAINKNTPLSVLMNFFNDNNAEYAEARNEAILNPNFSKDVLMTEWVKTEEEYKRSNDPKVYRRMKMLVDSSLWEYNELMDILETYGEEHNIRFAVLQNPAIPPSARALFVNDWSDYVGE